MYLVSFFEILKASNNDVTLKYEFLSFNVTALKMASFDRPYATVGRPL